jgi:hypothetical protein
MANSFSLTQTGSVPSSGILEQKNPFALKTPSTTTNNIAVAPTATPAQNTGLVNSGNNTSLGSTAIKGFLPETPVKSVTSADGTKTEFHAPETNTQTTPKTTVSNTTEQVPQSGMYDANTGLTKSGINANQVSQGYSPIPGAYDPVTGQLKNQGQSSTSAQNSNPNITPIDPTTGQPYHNTTIQSAANAVNAARQETDQEKLDSQRAGQLLNTQQVGQLAPFADANLYNVNNSNSRPNLNVPDFYQQKSSDQALYNNLSGLGYGAAQTTLANDATFGNRNLQGAEALLNSAAPVQQAGLLTNPYTGQPLNPNLVSNAVQQANQLVSNGTPITDPTVQALLSPFGFYGTSALVQAQQVLTEGTFNPANQAAAGQGQAQNIGTATTTNSHICARVSIYRAKLQWC